MTTADDLFDVDVDVDVPPRDEWLAEVSAALKGRPVESLVATTADGIDVLPLYTADDVPAAARHPGVPGEAPFVRGASGTGAIEGFDLRQLHTLGEPGRTNAEILRDLEGGATSVMLQTRRPPTVDDLDDALSEVLVDLAPVAIDAGPWWDEAGRALLALLDRRGLDAATRAAVRADPIGALARHGALAGDLDDALAGLARLVGDFADRPNITVVAADGSVWADAGASPATEVGFALADAVDTLRALENAGVDPTAAASRIEMTLTADTDQFTTIAKLRAARRCWARVLAASGVDASPRSVAVHVTTSATMVSRVDPWVNLLRTTVATFAAMAGGASSITVRPFDAAVGRPSELGRRLARNISHLLSEESGLTHVADPAGGSWYVEALTDALAEKAWHRLGEVESAGGAAAALRSGRLASILDEQWDATLVDLARRRRPLTGVSEFPLVDEERLDRDAEVPWSLPERGERVEALPLRRLAEPFEELRAAADARTDRTGERPAVFLANLGPPAVHTARATFAANTFAVGGIAAVDRGGHDDDESLVAAWRDSGAGGAVLCSSDDVYAERAVDAAAALRHAGCDAIWLAGRPGDDADALRSAGVVGFVHLGCDVLALLRDAHERLEVRS